MKTAKLFFVFILHTLASIVVDESYHTTQRSQKKNSNLLAKVRSRKFSPILRGNVKLDRESAGRQADDTVKILAMDCFSNADRGDRPLSSRSSNLANSSLGFDLALGDFYSRFCGLALAAG
ncbi:MAG: hypothetical protein AAGA60_31115 [Cyanobacteria bacterium P01_E01_bin.42]